METGFVIALVVVTAIMGLAVGMIIERFKKKPNGTQGTIYAYCGDPENGPSLLLEYGVPIDDIASRKRVTFDVVVIR